MPRSPARSRPPLAGEPILSSFDASRVVSMATHRPLEAETIAFFLDDGSCSNTITIVSGTTEADSIISVAECMAVAASRSPALCGVVLASVRPDTLGPAARRHRPLARGRRHHRGSRNRAGRVVHHRRGRRRVPP